jgi:hypothetical protein
MEKPPWGAEPRFELRPAIYSRPTTNWATLLLGWFMSWFTYPRWRKNCSHCHKIFFQTPTGVEVSEHKVHIYLEYHSVFPLFQTGAPPPPLPQASVPPPPRNQRGGYTDVRMRGWGGRNSDDWRKSLALCLLCGAEVTSSPPPHHHPISQLNPWICYLKTTLPLFSFSVFPSWFYAICNVDEYIS